MIKKMWAIYDKKLNRYFLEDKDLGDVIYFHNKNPKITDKKKYKAVPMWVSDRDPHENVRMQLKIYKEVGDNLCVNCEHFADAIEEDIKNTEGAG